MDIQLNFANGNSSAENLDFVNYYYDNEVKTNVKKAKATEAVGFKDFMDNGDSIPSYGIMQKKGGSLLNIVNRLNPATMYLRNGILASFKLNLNNVSECLRWSYLTPNEAIQKGIDTDKWKKLVAFRQRLDGLFYRAGGKPKSMEIAILSGKGNQDNGISDSGNDWSFNDKLDRNINSVSEHSSLIELLGTDLYKSENKTTETIETDAATYIATAKNFLNAVTKLLVKIGKIFIPNKAKVSNSENIAGTKGFGEFLNNIFGGVSNFSEDKKSNEEEPVVDNIVDKTIHKTKSEPAPKISTKQIGTKTGIITKTVSFYHQHKKLMLGASVGILSLVLLGLGIYSHLENHKNMEVKKEHHKANRNNHAEGIAENAPEIG